MYTYTCVHTRIISIGSNSCQTQGLLMRQQAGWEPWFQIRSPRPLGCGFGECFFFFFPDHNQVLMDIYIYMPQIYGICGIIIHINQYLMDYIWIIYQVYIIYGIIHGLYTLYMDISWDRFRGEHSWCHPFVGRLSQDRALRGRRGAEFRGLQAA